MIHLIGNPDTGLFEVVLISNNGKYIIGSKQGYARRSGAINAIKDILKEIKTAVSTPTSVIYQDDTYSAGLLCELFADGTWNMVYDEPKKKYVPQSNKNQIKKAKIGTKGLLRIKKTK